MKSYEELISQINELIINNQTEKALGLLGNVKTSSIKQKVTLLSNRFNRVKEEQIRGIINREDYQLEINKINSDILELLKFIERKSSPSNPDFDNNKKQGFHKYLMPSLIILLLILLSVVVYPMILPNYPTPQVTHLSNSTYEVNKPIQISYNILDYNGTLKISFIEDHNLKEHVIHSNLEYSKNGYKWIPNEDLIDKSGYIKITTKHDKTGHGNSIKLIEEKKVIVHEKKAIIDIGIESFEGRIWYSSIPRSTSEFAGFIWKFKIEYETNIVNHSKEDRVTFSLSLKNEVEGSDKNKEWKLMDNVNNITLEKGETRYLKKTLELEERRWPGSGGHDSDYKLMLCIKNSLDENLENNCITDTFTRKGITY